MSMYKSYYVIAGYDLTGMHTDKFNAWKWTEEGEEYICRQSKDNIQLFDDPMDSSHLYLGYVLASGDEYDFNTEKFNLFEVESHAKEVAHELAKLQDMGVIEKNLEPPVFQIIVFDECR